MAIDDLESPANATGDGSPRPIPTDARQAEEQVLPLFAEAISVRRETRETGRVRATIVTQSHEENIDVDLLRERIEVERIPIGHVVDAKPPVREEDGTVIIPVVEEILVVERRLFLKEEVHLRRVLSHERHVETVVTRSQDVQVTRLEPGRETPDAARPAESSTDHQSKGQSS